MIKIFHFFKTPIFFFFGRPTKQQLINMLDEDPMGPVDFNDEEAKEYLMQKRRILLPHLKKKWIKEAKRIEKETERMVSSPEARIKLYTRKKILNKMLTTIRATASPIPQSEIETTARIDELNKILYAMTNGGQVE